MNSINTDSYLALLKSVLCASIYEESAWRVVEGPLPHQIAAASLPGKLVARAQLWLVRFLRSKQMRLVRTFKFDEYKRSTGADWPLFGFTMTGHRRLDALQKCVEEILAEKIPGDLMETGVWRGGSVIFMRALLAIHGDTERSVWCADSFEGMPEPKESDRKLSATADYSHREYLTVSLEQVQKNFQRFGLLDERVKFLKGWFCDTLPTAPVQQLALLRLDGDLYESTCDALNCLYDKISPGGYVIVDDYMAWTGCRTAVDEFRAQRGITQPLVAIDNDAVLWRVQ